MSLTIFSYLEDSSGRLFGTDIKKGKKVVKNSFDLLRTYGVFKIRAKLTEWVALRAGRRPLVICRYLADRTS